jgi:hypothetical protein
VFAGANAGNWSHAAVSAPPDPRRGDLFGAMTFYQAQQPTGTPLFAYEKLFSDFRCNIIEKHSSRQGGLFTPELLCRQGGK